MKMYETTQSVEKYLNVPLECDCGRTHYAPIKAVDIRSGAINDLPGYASYDYRYCPYCKEGKKIDALVNSYGYSQL